LTTSPTIPSPESWASVTKAPDGSFRVQFSNPFVQWLTALWKNAGSPESELANNINSGVAAAAAAASAAQATANAAQEQVNAVGAETLTFSASASPISATGSGLSGVVQTNIVTVTPAGGTGPYTYSWTYVSGDAVTVLSPSSAATKFLSATSAEAVYKCTVTDSLLATAVVNVGISISNGFV